MRPARLSTVSILRICARKIPYLFLFLCLLSISLPVFEFLWITHYQLIAHSRVISLQQTLIFACISYYGYFYPVNNPYPAALLHMCSAEPCSRLSIPNTLVKIPYQKLGMKGRSQGIVIMCYTRNEQYRCFHVVCDLAQFRYTAGWKGWFLSMVAWRTKCFPLTVGYHWSCDL